MTNQKQKSAKSQVALVKCEDYDYTAVKKSVREGLELIGYTELFRPGERILLKPNLLAADPPDKCVTTHPSVFRATAELLTELGVTLSYGDSPAMNSMEKAARTAGLLEAAQELGITAADFRHGQEVNSPTGQQIQKFYLARGVIDSDGLVSLPKFKTHALTAITGAIKNQFGCIPGRIKSEFHVKLPLPDHFARMLIDLNLLIQPRLYIMDAIMAMDGNGPRRGKPFHLGMLLFSSDPVAVDATACRLIGLNPAAVGLIRFGQEAGLGFYESDKIEIKGDYGKQTFPNFVRMSMPATMPFKSKWLQNSFIPRPRIDPETCAKCGVCVNMCPLNPPAVDWQDDNRSKIPAHSYKNCIRCFCCQEVCPEGAIRLQMPLPGRIFKLNRGK